MQVIIRALVLAVACLPVHVPATAQTSPMLRAGYRQGDFKLVYSGRAAAVVVSSELKHIGHL